MKKTVTLVLIISITLGVVFYFQGTKILTLLTSLLVPSQKENQVVELTIWGLEDEDKILRSVLENYHQAHPNIRVSYLKQNVLNYQTRLDAQVKAGQGPDILLFYNSSIPQYLPDLIEAPREVIDITYYTNSFYPVAKDNLTINDKIYAVPLELDGLSLYYNDDILKAAEVKIPTTWPQFVDAAKKLTIKDSSGQIQQAGAALGTTTNVDFWPQIIGLLFLQQPNTSLEAPNTSKGAEVLQFYTNFVTDPVRKSWDTTLPSSAQMFISGKLAFYFATSKKASEIKKTNPSLNFKTAPVPQLPGKNVGWGQFLSLGVTKSSPYPRQSWEFLKYLTSSPALRMVYEGQSQVSSFGQPFARVDMAQVISSDPVLGSFITQGPSYKSWYLNSNTLDSGINQEMIEIYAQAVSSVLQGQDPLVSLQSAQVSIKQVLDKYNI